MAIRKKGLLNKEKFPSYIALDFDMFEEAYNWLVLGEDSFGNGSDYEEKRLALSNEIGFFGLAGGLDRVEITRDKRDQIIEFALIDKGVNKKMGGEDCSKLFILKA